jgi:hypothetical protein
MTAWCQQSIDAVRRIAPEILLMPLGLPRSMSRPEELAAIDSWVAENGLIPFPPRYAAGVLDHLPAYVIAQRLDELELPPSVVYSWLQAFLRSRNPPA